MTSFRVPAASPTPSAFFTLPNNTADSVLIPISTTPQPIALLNLPVAADTQIVLRGTVGWRSTGPATPKTDVVFKLWRGAPLTGQLIFSVDDSIDVDRNKVTEFAQVDSGFTTSQSVTYVLTAELVDPARAANVIGALTLTSFQNQ